jgi:hypothetical protein
LHDRDWTDYLLAADSASIDYQDRAFDVAIKKALAPLEDPRHDLIRVNLLGYTLNLASTIGTCPAGLISLGVGLFIARGDDESARNFYETWQKGMSLRDRLDVLSTFENAEDPAILQWLLGVLQGVVSSAGRQPNIDLYQAAVSQLDLLEILTGEVGHPFSAPLAEEIAQRRSQARIPAPPRLPLTGQRLTIIGGDPRGRDRLRQHFLGLGASEVRVVPPHWEGNVDERVIRSQVIEPATLAVLLTDRVGHQEQGILRNLKARFVLTQGGPSRVTRELLEYLRIVTS